MGFDQCYRIFALVNNTVVVPVFTILMKGKSTESYTNVFTAISNLINNVPIAAIYAHFDCEIGAVNAFRLIPCFQRVIAKMCTFHVRNNMHKKYQTLGLTKTFPNDVAKFINKFSTRVGGKLALPLGKFIYL